MLLFSAPCRLPWLAVAPCLSLTLFSGCVSSAQEPLAQTNIAAKPVVAKTGALAPRHNMDKMVTTNIVKTDVFKAGENGYFYFRIPGLVTTNANTLLLVCEARREHGDWSDLDTVLRRSEDGGKTWGPMIDVSAPLRASLVTKGSDKKVTAFNNPTLLVDRGSGRVHLLFCINYARLFQATSDDDGRTWSAPREITDVTESLPAEVSRKVVSPGPGHGIQLQKGRHAGRLLVSLRHSNGEGRNGTRPCWVTTLYSDDAGVTWQTGEVVTSDFADHADVLYPMEGALVELADGRVMMNIRNEAPINRRLVSTSPDGISNWTTPRVDEELIEPISFGALERLPAKRGGVYPILFVNPASRQPRPDNPIWSVRQNLTVRLSLDEGQSWPQSRVIEPGLAGYVDIAVGQDNAIFVAYERGDLRPNGSGNQPAGITLARFGWDLAANSESATNPLAISAAPK